MKDITILFSLANPISEEILVHKLFVKMFLFNHIARFFDHQYLKERYHFFEFLHGNIHQGKLCEITTFGWVCPACPTNLQTCLDLPGVPLSSLEDISR